VIYCDFNLGSYIISFQGKIITCCNAMPGSLTGFA